jgi:hypothetical protein
MAIKPELPHVGLLTDDEIAQAICNYEAKKHLGIEPDLQHLDFKLTYRQIKDGLGGTRLFASIVITGIGAPPSAPPKPEEK